MAVAQNNGRKTTFCNCLARGITACNRNYVADAFRTHAALRAHLFSIRSWRSGRLSAAWHTTSRVHRSRLKFECLVCLRIQRRDRANVIAPVFSPVNVPCKLGIYFSVALYPDAPRFRAQSVSRLLQFSINDALMARSARVMRLKQLDILPMAQSKDNGELRSWINSINNITLAERPLTAAILFCRSLASTIDDLIAEFRAMYTHGVSSQYCTSAFLCT